MKPIYLDYNATTPLAAPVKEAMLPYFENHFGNPSSAHWYGIQARQAIEEARRRVAALLNCGADEIYFTSGGSESNNLAIKGCASALGRNSGHLITSSIEHPAVLEVCAFLEQRGFAVTYLEVDSYGMLSAESIEKAIRPDTFLITIMHANNEVGTIQPIAEISRIAQKFGILFHTDAAQSFGKIPVRVDDLGVDLLSIAGHKFYAPKGIGALYVRRGVHIEKQMHGAQHERNLRAGTENVLEIVGLGAACEIAALDLQKRQAWLKARADQLLNGLTTTLSGIQLNGHPTQRLPNTVNVSFYGLDANTILSELDSIAASAGAACHADGVEASHVLTAMGVPTEWAMGTIRFSVGMQTTEEEINTAIEKITGAVTRLRGGAAVLTTRSGPEIKLTQFTHGLGCACKLSPQLLEKIISSLPRATSAAVLVGTETSDDAAVYQIDENTAIVQTVDFFTPIVDDPYQFGAIAAANALSDIYAMGGLPLFALNIVGFPSQRLPMNVLETILRGASDKAAEAGIVIIGGHTADDIELKYGMAVTGTISPRKILRNTGAQPGDVLILTKALGTGIITTANKHGLTSAESLASAIGSMSTLNKDAAKAAEVFEIHACTDITGFGLLGHLLEMTRGSRVGAVIYSDHIPLLPQVIELATAGAVPGGTLNNLKFVAGHVNFETHVSPYLRTLLADAQTSGGLLFAVAPKNADEFFSALERCCYTVSKIGETTDQHSGFITVC